MISKAPPSYSDLEQQLFAARCRIKELEALLKPAQSIPAHWGLTGRETEILAALCACAPRMTSRDVLLDVVWGADADPPERKAIDVFICKIRRKLKPHGLEIHMQYGLGYSVSQRTAARILEVPNA